MSRDGASDDALVREVEEKLLRKPTLSNLEVEAAIAHLAPAIHAEPSYNGAHRKKVEKTLKKVFGKRASHVGVYEDADNPGGYRIHVTPAAPCDTIHFTVTVCAD